MAKIKIIEAEIFGKALTDWVSYLKLSLKNSETVPSTNDLEVVIFGEGNLKIIELILYTFKLCKDNEGFRNIFIESQIFEVLKQILIKHKWNNFLHHLFHDIMIECLSFQDVGDNVRFLLFSLLTNMIFSFSLSKNAEKSWKNREITLY